MVTQAVAGVKFSTLPGFVIERVNPPDKGDSYVALTFDSHGRLVVSKEQDNPRILHRRRQGRRLRGRKGHHRQSQELPGPVVRRPHALRIVRPRPEGARSAPRRRRRPRERRGRGGGEQTGRHFQDGGHERRRRGGYAGHPGHGGRNPGARSARHPAPPDGGMAVIVGNNETIEDAALDLTSPVLKDKDAQFLPYFPNFGDERTRGRAQRDLRLESGDEEVRGVLRRQSKRLRLRLQPDGRGLSLRQRHGVGHRPAVVPRGSHRASGPQRQLRLSQRFRQVPCVLHRFVAADARP